MFSPGNGVMKLAITIVVSSARQPSSVMVTDSSRLAYRDLTLEKKAKEHVEKMIGGVWDQAADAPANANIRWNLKDFRQLGPIFEQLRR